MHLYYNSINDAFTNICRGFNTGEFADRNGELHPPLSRGPSRYGSVIRIEEPVTITYTNPLKRVLFHPIRDCNPWLHLIEALWMLAGQNRVHGLAHFAKRMQEFSDDDLSGGDIPFRGTRPRTTDFTTGYMWGAYGYRWRNWFKWDQLESCIQILRHDKITRRVVLDMWEPTDLQRVQMEPTCKDVPCNLLVMFSPRHSQETHRLHVGQKPSPREQELIARSGAGGLTHMSVGTNLSQADDDMQGCTLLDMTVVNRSNDTLWGALGSNYVHFSFLHEYIANASGMGVGHYHQMTNNLHIYTDQSIGVPQGTKEKWSGKWNPEDLATEFPHPYVDGYEHYPLYTCPFNDFSAIDIHRKAFDKACLKLFENLELLVHPHRHEPIEHYYFQDVVNPMLRAWEQHKLHDYDRADFHAAQIVPLDWRVACQQWLKRRATNYVHKLGVHSANA